MRQVVEELLMHTAIIGMRLRCQWAVTGSHVDLGVNRHASQIHNAAERRNVLRELQLAEGQVPHIGEVLVYSIDWVMCVILVWSMGGTSQNFETSRRARCAADRDR